MTSVVVSKGIVPFHLLYVKQTASILEHLFTGLAHYPLSEPT